MNKHPSAGKPVQVTSGPLKDRYFVVIDFLVNQYQGKDIKKIAKAHPELTRDLEKRKALDDTAVFGRLYPTMDYICLPDKELKVIVEEKPKAKLKAIKGGKDDTAGTTEGDSDSTEPGDSEPGGDEGRAESGDEEMEQVDSPFTESEESDSSAGSADSGPSDESNPPDKPKAKGGRRAAKGTSKK